MKKANLVIINKQINNSLIILRLSNRIFPLPQAPLVLLVLDVVASASISSPRDTKTHESMIQAFGMPKLSSELTPFGDNPVIERLQVDKNVKTSRRRFAIHKDSVREPSIQAYGLPKKMIESNGHIERVSVDRVSGLDGKVDKVHFRESPGIQAYGVTRRNQDSNGVIERIGSEKEGTGKADRSVIRRSRSLDDGDVGNDLTDLEPQEAKVFRPLFVYRQQVADRHRLKARKNPIYGAYQYGNGNRQRNSIHGYNKYY